MIWLWAQFLGCAGVIVGGGVLLVRFGDVIAERTGLGRLWAGALLLATATSLPELFTGLSSTLVFDAPDLAVSTVLGSCALNLLLLVALDGMTKRSSFFDGVNPAYIVESGYTLVLTVLVATGFLAGGLVPSLPWVWPGSLLVPVVYVVAVRVTMREGRYPPYLRELDLHQEAGSPEPAAPPRPARALPTLRHAVFGYAVSAVAVIAVSFWLPGVAEQIAKRAGIGETVVGGVLLALTTSLPEIVTTLAAFRIGAADMAFSNIMGSNLFNVVILSLEDMAYVRGPIMAHVSGANLLTAVLVAGMTGVVVVALAVRRQSKPLGLSWASIVLLAGFAMNVLGVALWP